MNVTITQNIQETLQQYLSRQSPSQLGVLVDENTYEHCYPVIQEVLPPHKLIQISSGELNKNLATCTAIWGQLTEAHFDRKALLINLGGGVIGDMGGFCAATYKRGIPFINLPTTLLAQVDASVGGKLGIDFDGYKNHIGLFQEPAQVIIDPHFLQSLPHTELRSGFAEVIKHCLIFDVSYWFLVKKQGLKPTGWTDHIEHSVKVKSAIVQADFKEGGLRKILNFGHTVGHAIESFFLETDHPLLHGEAIAIGMIAESYLSLKYCGMPKEEAEDISRFLIEIFGRVDIRTEEEHEIIQLALQDKKNERSQVRCSLLQRIGKAVFDVAVTPDDIAESLAYYRSLTAS